MSEKKHYLPNLDKFLATIIGMEAKQEEVRLKTVELKQSIFSHVVEELEGLDHTDPVRFDIFWLYVNTVLNTRDTVEYRAVQKNAILHDIMGTDPETWRDHWKSVGGISIQSGLVYGKRWVRRYKTIAGGDSVVDA